MKSLPLKRSCAKPSTVSPKARRSALVCAVCEAAPPHRGDDGRASTWHLSGPGAFSPDLAHSRHTNELLSSKAICSRRRFIVASELTTFVTGRKHCRCFRFAFPPALAARFWLESILPASRVNAVAETVAALGKGYRAIRGSTQLVTDGRLLIREFSAMDSHRLTCQDQTRLSPLVPSP
jgi:hypothetical protein